MLRESPLFDQTNGSVVEAYLVIRETGANIPPNLFHSPAPALVFTSTPPPSSTIVSLAASLGGW
jgi:hypothetical protein